MNGDLDKLDKEIKSKFKLFCGVRPEEEDQKIYQKVYDLCFDEILAFLGENLSEEKKEKFFDKLDEMTSQREKLQYVIDSLAEIEEVNEKLEDRLSSFLDGLLSSSLSNLEKE